MQRKGKNMIKKISFLALLIFIENTCFSQEEIDLGKIVITPSFSAEERSAYSVPYMAEEYDRKDIEDKGANNILDFLKKVPSVNISDWYGTGVKANVDLMGFGDNSLSNILVLVNGRRVNDIDLSGIDWTQIPLDNIDKIEIIKGGGNVLYGDNSSGGIINIITRKKAIHKPKFEIDIKGGSYSLDKESVYTSGKENAVSFSVYGEHLSTNGYRKNSQYRSKYANINVDVQLNNKTDLSFEFGHHRYHYGLPGAIYESDLSSGYTRRDSKYPNDNSRMEDNYIAASLKCKFSNNTSFMLDINYRNKNGVDNWLSYGGWDSIVDKHINSINLTPRLVFKINTLGIKHSIISGLEIFSADFSSDTNDLSIFNSDNFTDIDRRYRAVFINDTIYFNKKMSLNIGTRTQKEKFTFDYYSSSLVVDDNISFGQSSYEAGINYKLSNSGNVFINFSKGFRVPKTDEYFSAFASPPVNKSLIPQTSKTVITGINSQLNDKLKISADLFIMYLDNEIYYDPLTYANKNYDKTKHEGADINILLKPANNTELSGGYRFTQATFTKGDYSAKEIPAVPHSKINISLTHTFINNFSVHLDTLYRSKMYFINDINNALDKLESFWVTNIRISFKKKNIEFYTGINNLFNEKYSEYAATNAVASVKAIYPSPERNYFLGVKIKF